MSLRQQQHALKKALDGTSAHHAGVDVARPRAKALTPAATDATTETVSPPQRHGDRGSEDDAARRALPVFIRFTDLVAAGIVANWTTLLRLIETEGFPEGIMIGQNMRAWRLDDVEAWLASRPTGRKTMPEGCVPKRGRRRVEEGATTSD